MKTEIKKFGDKYIRFFDQEFGRTRESYNRFFDYNVFPEECRGWGFEMGCGQAMLSEINDIHIIGNGLFSQWQNAIAILMRVRKASITEQQ